MASDPTVDFPAGERERASEFGQLGYHPMPPVIPWSDRLDLLRIAHATTDAAIRRHALLLLDQAAAPAWVVYERSGSAGGAGGGGGGDLGTLREVTGEELAELRRKPSFSGGI